MQQELIFWSAAQLAEGNGVPFALKDAHTTAGMRTTTGFPPLDHVPHEDSTVAARLKAAGGILFGKTNVHAMLGDPAQTINPIFGRTNNPWDIARTPGGSSGGAAAAVAAGMTPFDIGTDLSGSIRIPAHFCGICGLKPTEHRVPLTGVVPGLQSPRSVRLMSCIGPMARTIDDLALLHGVIAGPDNRDTEVPPVPVIGSPDLALKDLRIAVALGFPEFPVSTEIRRALETLADKLRPLCAAVEQPPLPAIDFRHDLSRAGDVIGMMIGAFQPNTSKRPTTLAEYLQALDERDRSMIAWDLFLREWDVLLCPVAMTTAFPHCDPGTPLRVDAHDEVYWMVSAYATIFNYTGHPAIVMPYTLDRAGLPLGIQVVGQRWNESRLLAVAKAIGDATGGFERPPGY